MSHRLAGAPTRIAREPTIGEKYALGCLRAQSPANCRLPCTETALLTVHQYSQPRQRSLAVSFYPTRLFTLSRRQSSSRAHTLPAIYISQASLATLTHSPAPHPPESSQGNSNRPPFVVLQLAITRQPRHQLSGPYLTERSKLYLYIAAVYAIADLPIAGFNLNLDN